MQKSLNELTTKEVEQIGELAGLFFGPADISLIMEVDQEELMEQLADRDSTIFKAFYGARLLSEAELRKCVLRSAKSGSTPAQTMSFEMLTKSRAKLIHT